MKERPILFSPAMVRAILAGTKTQTRRLVFGKQAHRPGYDRDTWDADGYDVIRARDIVRTPWTASTIELSLRCPYGFPGSHLWVRETYTTLWFNATNGWETYYKADDNLDYVREAAQGQWKSPLFMPRIASRILLELTAVRVERLQDISEADCCVELGAPLKWTGDGPEPYKRDLVGAYRALWNSLNAKRGYGWETNCWVWVLTFERIDQ